MRLARLTGLPGIVLLLLALGGCATTGSNLEDNTGELGKSEQERTGAGDIYVKLAVAYLRSGKLDVALQQAKKAVKMDPGNGDALNVLALIYERLGEDGLAERYFQRGVAAEPHNSFLRNAFGAFLCKQGRYREAIPQFDAALKNPLYPTPEVAQANAGICYAKMGDAGQAETYLRAALRKNPRLAPALLEMAKVSLAKGDYLSARGYLQRFDAVAQHTAESLWLGVQIERRMGDRDALASYALQLRNKFPDSPEAGLLRASEQQ